MNETFINIRKYLYEHTSQETAYLVEGYPWGFRLKTTIRYWIETKKAKNGGQRFCSQTINPKTGDWCTPKYSTYSPIIIMFLNEDKHIKCTSLGHNSTEDIILNFKETHLGKLNEYQKKMLKEIMAYAEVMKHVTFTVKASPIGPVSLLSNDPEEVEKRKQLVRQCEERKLAEKESLRKINRAINYEISKIIL